MRYALALITIATAAAGVAHGAVVAADNFESYTAGQQLETLTTQLNGGTGFSGAYNIHDSYRGGATVSATSLSYTAGSLSINGGSKALAITGNVDVVNQFLYRQFPSQTGTLYFSFLYRTTNPANDEDFIQIGLTNSVVNEPQMSIGTGGGIGVSPFFVRIPTGSGNTAFSTTTLEPNTTYFMVGKISKAVTPGNYSRVSLFLNPTTLTEPVTPLLTRTGDSTLSSVSQFTVRIARLDSSETYFMDNLQIATSFSEVVPEPASMSVLAGGALLLMSRKRSTRQGA